MHAPGIFRILLLRFLRFAWSAWVASWPAEPKRTTTAIIMIMMATPFLVSQQEERTISPSGRTEAESTMSGWQTSLPCTMDTGHWTLDTKRGCRIKTVSRVAYELITGRKNPLLHTYIIAHNCMLCEDSSDCGWDCCYSTLCRYQCLISCHRRRPREIILVNRRISRRIRNGSGYAGC